MCADNKSENSTDDDSDQPLHHSHAVYAPLESKIKRRKSAVRRGLLSQVSITVAVMLSAASCGMPVGYSAILLPQLKISNDSMEIDDELGSWIASVHSAATPFGSLLSGVLMDRFGRRLSLQIASLPLILGWLLIGLSQNYAMLLLGRLVAGLSAGLTAAAGQVLIGEVTEPHLRGMLSSGPFASYSFGILLVYALGSLFPWRHVAGLSTILPIISTTAFFFLPESPVWLVRNGKTEKAKEALTWLRGGNSKQAKQETQQILERINHENSAESEAHASIYFQPQVIKPLVIINIFNILQVLSGTYLIVFYAVDMISHFKEQSIDHFLAASLTACVRFIFTIIASTLLALVGRRSLALASGLGTTAAAFCLGIMLTYGCSNSSQDYLAAFFILIYVAANTIGFFVLPGVMLAELFPAKIRGNAGGFSFMVFNLALFGVAKIFPMMKNMVGINGVFWIFGTSSLVASVFLYLMLPETKGKSLNEIEDYFQQKNTLWVTRDQGRDKKFRENETEVLKV